MSLWHQTCTMKALKDLRLCVTLCAAIQYTGCVAKPPQLAITYARELTHLLAMVKRVPAGGLHWVYKPLQRSASRVGYYGGRST